MFHPPHRRAARLWPIALSLLALASCSSTQDDAKQMNGTWLPTSAELSGEQFPDEVRQSIKLVIADGTYTVNVGDKPDKGTVKLDTSSHPRSLDILGIEGPNKGKTILAIYKLNGDVLTVCYDLSSKARPADFKTSKDSQLFLVTYEREKP